MLIGLHVALFATFLARLFVDVSSGADPWAGMAVFYALPIGVVVFPVLLSFAAIGVVLPLALLDLASAWFFLALRDAMSSALAVGFSIAFGVGVAMQVVVIEHRRHLRR